jgi:hypothetical protein
MVDDKNMAKPVAKWQRNGLYCGWPFAKLNTVPALVAPTHTSDLKLYKQREANRSNVSPFKTLNLILHNA